MRMFQLRRETDPTGISGTGVVAEGVEYSDGSIALRWLGIFPTTTIHRSMRSVLAIHGHNGSTRVEWLDKPSPHGITTTGAHV